MQKNEKAHILFYKQALLLLSSILMNRNLPTHSPFVYLDDPERDLELFE